jgi:hypothetical protein
MLAQFTDIANSALFCTDKWHVIVSVVRTDGKNLPPLTVTDSPPRSAATDSYRRLRRTDAIPGQHNPTVQQIWCPRPADSSPCRLHGRLQQVL